MQVCDKCKVYGVKANKSVGVELNDCDDYRDYDFNLCEKCHNLLQKQLRKFFNVKIKREKC